MATNRSRFEAPRFPSLQVHCRDCGVLFEAGRGYVDTQRFMAQVCKPCADKLLNPVFGHLPPNVAA
jgi:hypothetical protein